MLSSVKKIAREPPVTSYWISKDTNLSKPGKSAQRIILDTTVAAGISAIGVATGSDGFAPLFPTDIIIHHAASNNLTIHIAFNLGNETDAHAHDLRGTDLLSSLYSLLISSSRITPFLLAAAV